MGKGNEERKKRLNKGRFAHEFTQIYSNWRLFWNGITRAALLPKRQAYMGSWKHLFHAVSLC